MSSQKKKYNFIILATIFIYGLLYFTLIIRFIPSYAAIINCVFIFVITYISYLIYGFQKYSINKIRKKIIYEVFLAIFIYFTVIYLLGLFTGYLASPYSLNIISIIKNSILPLISVISIEIFRYIFISSNRDLKNIVPIVTIAIILLDIILNFYFFEPSLVKIFVFLSVTILPIIFKNIVLSYLSYQVGYEPCLIYVIPLVLFKFIVPVVPNLGNYLTCIIGISLPSMIFIYAARMISHNLDEENKNNLNILKVFFVDIPLLLFFTIFIGLISGHFNYHLIGIDASLMEPRIKRGDAVMIYKNLSYENYEEGDVVAYSSGDKIIMSKISKKDTDLNGYTKLYITIEVNEGKEDTYYELTENELIGKYNNFKVSKIAYPTIWFKEFIRGDVNEN